MHRRPWLSHAARTPNQPTSTPKRLEVNDDGEAAVADDGDGGSEIGVLEEGSNEWFGLRFNEMIDVFENRIAFGDAECAPNTEVVPTVREGRFTIDSAEDKGLLITNEGSATANLVWIEINFD